MSSMKLSLIDEGKESFSQESGPTVIKVIGVGGGGSNAVNRMIASNLQDVQFVAMNTDLQALDSSRAALRIPLGTGTTKGLGAGGDPSVGEKAALEDKETIKRLLGDADMVFITAGMGGGTGTGAAPVIASVAKEMGILCVAVVTKPFSLEGRRKNELAEAGIAKLRENVDTLITIPNQNLLRVVQKTTPLRQAFLFADDVLRQGVQGISDLITKPGDINIDFADVRTIMKGRGDALMGIGIGHGETKAVDAATNAINNPLLDDTDIGGAKGILVNVTGGLDFSLADYEEVMNIVSANADPDALIIAGTATDEALEDSVQVTVIATGFNHSGSRLRSPETSASRSSVNSYSRPSEAPRPESPRESSSFSLESWNELMSRNPAPKTEESGFSRHQNDTNLETPTYLRRKAQQEKS